MSRFDIALITISSFMLTYGLALVISGQLRRPVRCLLGWHTWRRCRYARIRQCRYCPKTQRIDSHPAW